ncbi:YqhV family protein [Fredinandcohnia sp. 179-A 10B2 NHS]|uniref:YqhV family protein n=1 Tax=Fredinandcohnia sp. 179-A 10B2 NHS TaxID=3235176 RepID=UPI0039A1FE44
MKRLLSMFDTTVLSMAGLRVLSASLELTAAILMLVFNDVRKALAINALLAIVGPIIMITTMAIGLISLADQLSYSKLLFIGLGVAFILYGIYR